MAAEYQYNLSSYKHDLSLFAFCNCRALTPTYDTVFSLCRMLWKLGFDGFSFGFHGIEVLSCGLTSTNDDITTALEMLYIAPDFVVFMFVSSKMPNENVFLCAHD